MVAADARTWRPAAPVDAVLVDAPCLATGTAARHPDALWLKRPAQLKDLVALQTDLVDAAIDMLRPGGVIVYATCSLEPEEGERRGHAMARMAALEPAPIVAAEVGGHSEYLTAEGWLRTRPDHRIAGGGLEGFFAARFRRRA